MLLILLLLLSLLTGTAAQAAAPQSRFEPAQQRWIMANGTIQAVFHMTSDGRFQFESLRDLVTGDAWNSPGNHPSSPVRFQVDGAWLDYDTPFQLLDQYTEDLDGKGIRQVVVLQDPQKKGELRVALELFADQPVLRHSVSYRNLQAATSYVTWVNMVPWTFRDEGEKYAAFRVNQWVTSMRPEDFEALQTPLDPTGKVVEVYSGAAGQQCAWLVLRDSNQRGLFTGWEFDGRARTSVRQYGDDGYLQFASNILDLHHPVAQNEDFLVPPAFIGLFHGDWDEAGYRTQRFAEAVIAKPFPDSNFPYVGWDSWAYTTDFDEPTLRRNAEMAAGMGVELFILDLGWARNIGDWYTDRQKLPGGVRTLSDYVHSLGMKFGLHFAWTEAAADSPVLIEHPDWTSSQSDNYFGAESLCLSNQPTKEWLVNEAIRLIDDYNPDWILQDGENMVKQCTKTTHTHDPQDSNYANAVDGLNAIIQAVQQQRPKVVWENCEDGGNMMTFNMLRNYVTSITNDASGALSSRRAVYGATYPFPPRYTDRYMPEQDPDPYVTRSYMFGGPWLMMNRLPELSPDQLAFLASEIQVYKSQRALIQSGKVFHLAVPAANHTDAIQSYDLRTDSSMAVVTRDLAAGNTYLMRPRGLRPSSRYRVSFQDDPRTLILDGATLMSDGVRVNLPEARSAEIVYLDPLD